VWPRLSYAWFWGPRASALGRGLFEMTTSMHGVRADADSLRKAGLLATSTSSDSSLERPDVADLEVLLDRAHAQQIAGIAPALDSARRAPDGSAVLTMVPSEARHYRRRGAHFFAARDADRRWLNQRFGATLLTEDQARQTLSELKSNVRPGYRDYSPIDFGGGLTVGQIASTDSGTGRWDFFNGRIVGPLVAGKRVLDLGCNNGSLPLMMVRAGAREVVAIEFDPAIADFARLNARILAWRDIKPYRMQVLTGDMRLVLTGELGEFDVVTAFCSLYYLPVDDMARIIAHAAAMGATLILQANEAIDNLPAKTNQLLDLMRANGFRDVQVHAPSGFARPLLVGTPTAARHRRETYATAGSPVTV
jgi:SAM-dependent methyltransferase